MRTKKEIEEEAIGNIISESQEQVKNQRIIIELLLDIRKLLMEKLK